MAGLLGQIDLTAEYEQELVTLSLVQMTVAFVVVSSTASVLCAMPTTDHVIKLGIPVVRSFLVDEADLYLSAEYHLFSYHGTIHLSSVRYL